MPTTKTGGLLRRYYLLKFTQNLSFALPIWVVFGPEHLHLTYLQGLVLLTLPDLVSTALAIPIGALADRFGRRRVYRLGLLLSLAGSLPFVVTTEIALLYAFMPLAGVGLAMTAASLDAIVSAELHDHHEAFGDSAANQRVAFFAGRITGGMCGAALYSWEPTLPFLAISLSMLACFAIAHGLPKDASRPVGRVESSRQAMATTLRLFIGRSDFAAIALVLTALTIATNTAYIAYQPVLIREEFSRSAFGLIFAAFSACSIMASRTTRTLIPRLRAATLLRLMCALASVTAFALVFASGWWVVLATVPLQVAFGMMSPVVSTYVSCRTPVGLKATALSFVEMAFHSWVLSAFIAGFLLDEFGIETNLVVAGAATLACLVAVPAKALGSPVIPPSAPETEIVLDERERAFTV
jgi:MFS family permease